MSNGVNITSCEKVSLPQLSNAAPPIKLSMFDAIWIPFKPVQKVLIYSCLKPNISYSAILENLKASLSSVLLDFLPLAGKLTYVPETEDVEIDLSDLSFTLVEAESDLDAQQLSFNQVIDVGSFSKLVPVVDSSVLPFHVLAVQVTRFRDGGVAIGYSIHHMAADGNATNRFAEAWSSTCKAKLTGVELPNECGRSLIFDREVIKHPRGEQIKNAILHRCAPGLPSTNHPRITALIDKRSQLGRRTFEISKESIHLLKQHSTSHVAPSSFSAISAYIWATVARSKSFDPNQDTAFCITMDCRTRLNPPVPDGFIGNCIRAVITKMMSSDLIGEEGLVRACKAIREAVDEVAKDPLGSFEELSNAFASLPFGRVVSAAGSPKFRVYDNDFGWGRPDRFEMVSMNSDGDFALVAGKEEGSVQMTIAISPDRLDVFTRMFLEGLNG